MILIVLATILIVTVFWLHFGTNNSQKCKLPAGPRGLPLIGNILQFVRNPHLKLTKWAKEYGDLYTIYIGSTPTVVVTDATLQRELFSLPASTGKFSTDTVLIISQGPYGIISSEGKQWQEQRHFCHKSLKQFGFGSGSQQESRILLEAEAVCDWIINQSKANNGIVYLNQILNMATNNTLWSMVSGERMELGNSKIVHLMEKYIVAIQYTMKTGLGFLPWLKHVAPKISGYTDFDQICKQLHQFVGKSFEKHKSSLVKDSPPRDLMDAYLIQLEKSKTDDTVKSFKGDLGFKNAVSAVVELFIAGSESTAVVINWLIFYLVQNRDVQNKLHEEIDCVIGRDRQPSLSDKTRMPFTNAVIQETLRFATITPQGLIHKLEEDIQFCNYCLPKGTLLLSNLYGIHYNAKVWGDPEVFRPDRFLEAEGSKLKEHFVAFQPGRRVCLGEQMALDVLFLFVTKLFQTFRVSKSPQVEVQKYSEADVGILLLPKKLGVVMKAR